VTVLGSGDAFASGGRAQSGYVIEANGTQVLLEAGPGLLETLKRHGFNPARLDYVVISHLHGDHYGGIPFLMLEYLWESPLDHIVTIAGPRGLESRSWRLMKTMYPRSAIQRLKPRLRFKELAPGKSARLGPLKIDAIRSPHTSPDISLSLKLHLAGRSIAFSGDSGWNDDLVELAQGADLFLCECTYYESKHLTFHLNYPLIMENRDRFKVSRMVLTHLGREVLNHKSEIAIEMASDGLKIEL